MPTIGVDGPSITVEQKKELVKKLTEDAVEVYGIEHIIVIIRENIPDNVGIDGELLSERRKSS